MSYAAQGAMAGVPALHAYEAPVPVGFEPRRRPLDASHDALREAPQPAIGADLPTFIIIGAARSGTTSLYEYLRQHPEVAMSRTKETYYLAWELEKERAGHLSRRELDLFYPVRSLDAYRAQFAWGTARYARGEASPRYLILPGIPEQIASLTPEARLIVVLREPVRRFWAQYMVLSRWGYERRSPREAIEQEIAEIDETPAAGGRPNVLHGLYHRHLCRFLEVFPRDRLLILLNDDLERSTKDVMQRIMRFIGIDPRVPLDLSRRHGPAGFARFRALDMIADPMGAAIKRALPPAALSAVQRVTKPLVARNTVRPEMPLAAAERLRAFYRPDTEALESLLGRDLSGWLGPAAPEMASLAA